MSNWLNLSDNDIKVITSEEDLFVVKANNTLIEIPNNATNGEVIKALFPKLKINETYKGFVLVEGKTENISIWNSWWNAPYKENEIWKSH